MIGSEKYPLFVSVIVPTYNRAHLLLEAVESVVAQTYPNWELLIIDDGSTDETPSVLARYADDCRIRVFRQPNSGQAKARNVGIRNARGDFIAFLDSDNRWLPEKISRQVECLVANPDVDVIYGDIEEIDLEGNWRPTKQGMTRHSGEVWRPLLVDNFVNFNTSVVRTAKLRAIGGLDESVRRADDYDLWLRLSTTSRFQFLPGVLAQYRVAGDRISDNISGRLESNLAGVERFLTRNPELLKCREQDAIRAKIHARFARAYSARGEMRNAIATALAAVRLNPRHIGNWRALAGAFIRPLRGFQRET